MVRGFIWGVEMRRDLRWGRIADHSTALVPRLTVTHRAVFNR
jgi:hypothetical protein